MHPLIIGKAVNPLLKRIGEEFTYPTVLTQASANRIQSYADEIRAVAQAANRELSPREKFLLLAIDARLIHLAKHGIKPGAISAE